jgi:outer membrane protein assembly factor BamB
MHGTASVYDGKLYFIDSRSTLHVVDTATDETVKELSIGEGWSVCTPAVDNKIVVVSDGAGTITALDKMNLETLWTAELGPSVLQMSPYRKDWKGLTSSPTLTDGLVFIGGSDGMLYALDRETGKIIWRHAFGLPVLSTPAITGNLLLVSSYDGHVYAFAGKN